MNKRVLGTQYEERAVAYLKEQGYRNIERNYRNRQGEIDWIAEDKDGTIVYGETKYRSSGKCGDPLEAVDYRKQKRISRVALYHYSSHGYEGSRPCRFDVIAIYGDGRILHIKNAFEFCG